MKRADIQGKTKKLLVLMLIVSLLSVYAPITSGVTLAASTIDGDFFDDFSEGAINWTEGTGSWSVAEGEYRQTNITTSGQAHRFATTITGRTWDDAIYEVTMKYESGASWGAFLFRKTNQVDHINNSGYFVNWMLDGTLELNRGGSKITNLATVQTGIVWNSADNPATYHRLTIANKGSNIKVFIDDSTEPIINVNDTVYTSGYAGLGVHGSQWSFDNVSVTDYKAKLQASHGIYEKQAGDDPAATVAIVPILFDETVEELTLQEQQLKLNESEHYTPQEGAYLLHSTFLQTLKAGNYSIELALSSGQVLVYSLEIVDTGETTEEEPEEEPGDNPVEEIVVIHPEEYTGAIKNPLMGMAGKDFFINTAHPAGLADQPLDHMPWATLMMTYIPWDRLENDESDGIEKIEEYLDERWRGKDSNGVWHQYEEYNMKIIPRVYLRFPSSTSGNTSDFYGLAGDHWPADMRAGDFTSEQFDQRLKRLVEKLGQLWDNDPRVAYIQMGVWGTWGEHHGTAQPANIGQYFEDNFTNKKVQVRYHHNGQWDANNSFGHYNDSIGNLNIDSNYQTKPIGGEPGYDYVGQTIHGWSASETFTDEDYMYNTANMIRFGHVVYLTWLGEYTYGSRWVPSDEKHWGTAFYLANKAEIDSRAEVVQKELGYRYVMSEFSYPEQVNSGEKFNVSFKVKNMGSAPMYYNWPVQVSLKDPVTNEIVWSDTFKNVDIRDWQPGSGFTSFNNRKDGNWSNSVLNYNTPPAEHHIRETFTLSEDVAADKEYIIQLAVLDPGGNVPSLRFSIENYKAGGYHPMGYIGIGTAPTQTAIDSSYFDSPAVDVSLRYYRINEEVPTTARTLSELQISGNNVLLAPGEKQYDLENLSIRGVDSQGNIHNLDAATVEWSIASGEENAQLTGSMLEPVSAGIVGITATYHGVSSNVFAIEITDQVGTIKGKVSDRYGNAVVGAAIVLSSEMGSYNTTTDGDGNYQFEGIFANTEYTLTASKAAYLARSASITNLLAGETKQLNLTIKLDTGGYFFDDFSNGTSAWTAGTGTWVIDNEQYVQTRIGGSNSWRYMSTITGKVWEDAIYEVDIEYGNDGKNWGAFLFRKTSQGDTINNSGYFVDWQYDGRIELMRGASSLVMLATANRETDWTQPHHLKIVNIGSNIKIYVDHETEPVIDVNDSTFKYGYAGIGANGSRWAFDNVQITDASQSVELSLLPSSVTIELGGSQLFTVSGAEADEVTWTISDTSNKVVVDDQGLVIAEVDAEPGTYIITATSKLDNTQFASAMLTVKAPVSYSIAPIEDQLLSDLVEGYLAEAQEAREIIITNTGTGALSQLQVTLEGEHANKFLITQPSSELSSGEATSFIVKATDGLVAGTYIAKIIVTADQIASFSFNVTQTVMPLAPTVPAKPQELVASSGNRVISLQWNGVANAESYKIYMATTPGEYNEEPIATVTSTTYEVSNLTNGTEYFFIIRAANAGGLSDSSNEVSGTPVTVPGAPTNVRAKAGNGTVIITFTAPVDDGGSLITGYEVTNTVNGNITSGSSSPIVIPGLTNGTSYSFTVTAVNTVGKSTASEVSNTVTPTSPSRGDGSGSGNDSSTIAPADNTSQQVTIIVNGKADQAATSTTIQRNNQSVSLITFDQNKWKGRLQSEDQHAVITIPVSNTSNVVIGELTGTMIQEMEEKQAIVQFMTNQGGYTIAAEQLNLVEIVKQLGNDVKLQDVKVQLEIAEPTDAELELVKSTALQYDLKLTAPALQFSIKVTSGEKTVELTQFAHYVERMIKLPQGVNHKQISTAVVIEKDGTMRHVPTKIILIDGNYYVQINSLTNSLYSAVWSPQYFTDTANHWAQQAIQNMGSRLIIEGIGDGQFAPDREITRAEFAAIIVRALGLKPQAGEPLFSDVKGTEWYSNTINTAYAYGLINGYSNGSFHANEKITREQAMLILSRARELTGLKVNVAELNQEDILAQFKDRDELAAWAQGSVTENVHLGLITGRSTTELAPKGNMTRAEVATIVQRLLQQSDLID